MEHLNKIMPREKIGSSTYNKYKFQIAVAIELLLDLAGKSKDFWLLMDYLEDVVIIEDYDKDVSLISFYQVKSKEKNAITIGNVISEKFLNKMHYNVHSFRDHHCDSVLMTNCGISFDGKVVKDTVKVNLKEYLEGVTITGNKDNDEKENSFRLKKKDEILNSISKTEKIPVSDIDISKFYLLTTTLTLDDYERQISGAFVEYMNSTFPKLSVESIYTIKEKIWRDLDKKNAFIIGDNSVDQSFIVKNKGITSRDFNEIIQTQDFLQFPTFSDIANFCNQYGSSFGDNPIRDKAKYDEFMSDCIIDERNTLALLYTIFNQAEEKFADVNKSDLIPTLNSIIEEDSRITNLKLYNKYKELFHVMYLYKKLEV